MSFFPSRNTISDFRKSTPYHPCPICNHSHPEDGQHGDCRETTDGMWLCHRYRDAEVPDKSHCGNFFYVGSTNLGAGWGKWLPLAKFERRPQREVPKHFKRRAEKRPLLVMDAKDVAAGKFNYEDERKPDDFNASSISDMRDLFLRLYGHRLGFDVLKQCITIDEEPITNGFLERAYLVLDDEFGVVARKGMAIDAFEAAAHKHEYHPLRRYFLGLNSRFQEGTLEPADLDGLVRKYLRDEDSVYDDLYSNCLRRWLIALVKRTFEPGADFDECLVLVGIQGARKGHFFRALAGGQRFYTASVSTDHEGELTTKTKQTIHSHSVVEIPEIGARVLRHERKNGGSKSWIDQSWDNFFPQYGRISEDFKRRFVLCATENLGFGFLSDETGSRRFPCIPTTRSEANPIDIDGLIAERDSIMLAAYLAYRSGEPTFMPEHLVAVRDEANTIYAQEATLAEEAHAWCLKQKEFTLRDFYDAVWRQPPHEFKRYQNEMGKTLASFSWISRCKIPLEDGRRVNGYRVDTVRAAKML